MTLYPLLMAPYFRAGSETPWGGSMLRDAFMKEAPERCGESLELSMLPARESCVRNGEHAGVTLAHMRELWGEALTGTSGEFPLRLKLIDAAERVDCDSAPEAAWVVLNCAPGAKLEIGAEFAVRPGQVFAIPAGTARAIDADTQIYALEADAEAQGEAKAPRGVTALCKGGSRTYYISDANMELCRLNVSGNMPVSDGRMLILTPLGPCKLRWGADELDLMPFDTVLIPAALENVSIESEDCKVLMASLPNREALKSELNYRAASVAGLED